MAVPFGRPQPHLACPTDLCASTAGAMTREPVQHPHTRPQVSGPDPRQAQEGGRAEGQGGGERAAATRLSQGLSCGHMAWCGHISRSVKVTYPDARSQSLVLHVLVTPFRILSVQ